MNFKKTWTGKYGKSEIMTKENSACKLIELDMLKLDGGTKAYCETDKEYGVLILSGVCTVEGEGFKYENIGSRASVFDGPATCVYVPCNTPFSMTGSVRAAVCKSPCAVKRAPALVRPEDVVVKDMGRPGWRRQAHFILDERVDAEILYIGEAYVEGGQWASYPPHKHDDDNMPTEANTEEVYYYEFKTPQGFGIQKVYTKEGDIDETYTVKTGDVVEIPRGYHPFHSAPGYDSYYLWIMAGKNRGFFMTTDEEHKWLNG